MQHSYSSTNTIFKLSFIKLSLQNYVSFLYYHISLGIYLTIHFCQWILSNWYSRLLRSRDFRSRDIYAGAFNTNYGISDETPQNYSIDMVYICNVTFQCMLKVMKNPFIITFFYALYLIEYILIFLNTCFLHFLFIVFHIWKHNIGMNFRNLPSITGKTCETVTERNVIIAWGKL